MRRTVRDLLNAEGLRIRDERPGEHTTTCPRCSADRKPANRRKPCLSVKVDDLGITWCCHHCGWSGGSYFETSGGTRPYEGPRKSTGGYGKLQRGARAGWR